VFGRVGGEYTKGISTGLKDNKANRAYVKKNKDVLLAKLLAEKNGIKLRVDEPTVSEYGLEVVERGNKKEDNKGRVGKRGRNAKNQRDVVLKFEKHIKPFFKNTPLTSVTTTMVNEWQEELLQKLSPSTVTKLRAILHKIFYEAIGEELVTKNPVEYADRFENYSEKRDIYEPNEVSKMLESAKGFMKLYLSFIAVHGLRPSEIHGLVRDDFDMVNGVLYLNRAYSTHISTNEDDPQLEFLKFKFGTKKVLTYRDSTKNHKRVIVLTPTVWNCSKSIWSRWEQPNCFCL
jgi:integrase